MSEYKVGDKLKCIKPHQLGAGYNHRILIGDEAIVVEIVASDHPRIGLSFYSKVTAAKMGGTKVTLGDLVSSYPNTKKVIEHYEVVVAARYQTNEKAEWS